MFRSNKSSKRFGQYDTAVGTPAERNTSLVNPAEWDLERPHPTKAENVFLYGAHPETGEGFILRIKHRPGGKSRVKLQIQTSDGVQYEACEEFLTGVDERTTIYQFPGISLEVVKPCRRFRLVVRSYMTRVTDSSKAADLVFVRMRCLVYALSDVYDLQEEASSHALNIDRYQQFVYSKAKLWIESEPEVDFHLWGCRSKTFFDGEDLIGRKFVTLYGYDQYGFAFTLTSHYDQDSGEFYGTEGFAFDVLHSGPLKKSVKNVRLDECQIQENGWVGSLKLTRNWTAKINPVRDDYNLFQSMKLKIEDQDQAHTGLAFITSTRVEQNPEPDQAQSRSRSTEKPLIVNLHDDEALDVSLTGGKGQSLAELIRQSNAGPDSRFTVPEGFVITSEAYAKTVQCDRRITAAIQELQRECAENGGVVMEDSCRQVQNLIKSVDMSQEMLVDIKKQLLRVKGNRFAVRSSGCGFEDSADLSAAGQMDTFLGVSVKEDLLPLLDAIRSCWASQFSPVAVEYKRGYGLPLDSKMAVVVQEMVPNVKSAGVLFTCDPLTGNERIVSISGNFGLGESVVSAMTDPDTIRVGVQIGKHSRKVTKILEIAIGSKNEKIIQTDTGTAAIKSSAESASCCLAEEEILRLATVALKTAQKAGYSGGPRDIEWAIDEQGTIFLLQSRPITSLDRQWTPWEILHEVDSGLESPHEFFSMGNVSEVMPSQASHLLIEYFSISMLVIVELFPYLFGGSIKYSPQIYARNAMINWQKGTGTAIMSNGSIGITPDNSPFSRSLQLCFFGGYLTENPDLMRILRARLPEARSTKQTVRDALHKAGKGLTFLTCYRNPASEREERRLLDECLSLESQIKQSTDVREAWKQILRISSISIKMFLGHLSVTMSSGISNMLIISVLKAYGVTDEDLLGRMTVLLGDVGGVVSGDCPAAIGRIAESIDEPSRFCALRPEKALTELKNGSSLASRYYEEFMAKYGHRGYMEIDPAYPRWEDSELELVESIQTMLKCGIKKTDDKKLLDDSVTSQEEILNTLSGPMKAFTKYVAIPLAKKRIRAREWYKSTWIHSHTALRRSVIHVGQLLVREGRLPDGDLVFHMSIDELNGLITSEDPNPRLISKAKARKRLFVGNKDVRYPPYMTGTQFESLQDAEERLYGDVTSPESSISIAGSPVYAGKVRGRAFVARTIEELKNSEVPLARGDILVTRGTDIAWSPVFPLLGGLITEIGGICSHGAVIAREYALPCLIGVQGATRLLRTGQQVELDSQFTNSVKLIE